VGKKLCLSFSKSRLDENIAKLRSDNDDLRNLSLQTRRPFPVAKRMGSKLSQTARYDIRKYQTIRKASCQVYEALRKACTKHTDHMAHFRMEAEHVVPVEESPPQVKFNMAFTHRLLTGNLGPGDPGPGDPVWFLVDSIINEHVGSCSSDQMTCRNELEISLKRQLEPCLTPVVKKVKKSVRFAASMSSSMPTTSLSMPTTSLSMPTTSLSMPSTSLSMPTTSLSMPAPTRALETCGRKDFCDYIRRYFCPPLQANACILLENTAECKQMVYPSPLTISSESRKATSLAQLITTTGVEGILIHERIGLAKSLAIAVLQYHATPWLQISWRSEDILFYGIEGDMQMQKRPNLSAPYINANIQGQFTQAVAQRQSAMARNPILFSLGTALIEIAHSASLESLKLPCDADNGELHCEFFAARRLAKSKRTIMGLRYDNIVEQLVECDFSYGDDLNKPELQASFYEDVICELDELEQGFRKFCIGEPDS
jgi:hypothetical protein